jgi:hypothetical protein
MDCVVCQMEFEPEEINGVRRLKTFKGYTVDLRLRQFRKVPLTKLPEFIDFDSPQGQELVMQMHERAIALANGLFKRAQKRK